MSGDDSLDEEIVESEVELDNSDVVEPDYDPFEEAGDPFSEVTEENQEAAHASKSRAMDAIFEGKLDEAVEHLTEAIILNPKSAVLFASRASVFVKMKKPNAAIRDTIAALTMNPDLVKGYKARGMARALLGLWDEAARDLCVASKLDFDEETSMVLRKVESNCKKIEEHRIKYERLRPARDAKFASMLKDGHVIKIKSANELKIKMNAATKLSRLIIVYLTAKGCGPCRYVAPIYANLAGKYPKVVFLKLDIDKVQEAAMEFNISSIPSFYLSKNGIVVDNEVNIDTNSLEKKITQHS